MTDREKENGHIALAIVDKIKNNLDVGMSLDKLSRNQMLFMLETIRTLVNFKR